MADERGFRFVNSTPGRSRPASSAFGAATPPTNSITGTTPSSFSTSGTRRLGTRTAPADPMTLATALRYHADEFYTTDPDLLAYDRPVEVPVG